MRLAVLGTGPVSRKFVLGLRALRGAAQVSIVASRSEENARAFARDFAVPAHTADIAEAVGAATADAVYVATPPSEHEAHSLAALGAGKPVLVEKPFAMDAAAARRIADAARAAGVFCMEAMWTRFQPLVGDISERLGAGEIGILRGFHGSFYGNDRPDSGISLFDPARGGGALMHRGVYALSLARLLLGPIASVKASATIGETGVDEDAAVLLTHASGAISSVRASLRAGGPSDGLILGDAGTVRIAEPIYRPFRAEIVPSRPRAGGEAGRLDRLREGGLAQGFQQRAAGAVRRLRSRKSRSIVAYYAGNGYHYQVAELMRAVRAGETESPVMPLDQSVDVMEAVDAAKANWSEDSD